jgi:hypothetical protein
MINNLCQLWAARSYQPMAIQGNTAVLSFWLCCHVHSVLYNRRYAMLILGVWCLYINPSGEASSVCRSHRIVTSCQKCACWPARNHHSNVRFDGQDCNDDTACIPHHLMETATKKTKVQCSLNHLSTTSMGISWIEDKQKRSRKNIFPLVGSGTFLQYATTSAIVGPSNTLKMYIQITCMYKKHRLWTRPQRRKLKS